MSNMSRLDLLIEEEAYIDRENTEAILLEMEDREEGKEE